MSLRNALERLRHVVDAPRLIRLAAGRAGEPPQQPRVAVAQQRIDERHRVDRRVGIVHALQGVVELRLAGVVAAVAHGDQHLARSAWRRSRRDRPDMMPS